ncbi:fatty acid amide hydrolase [Phtheirospermum japonicum]|uniref:Fatty acid amide hydrolase n=1 Tax=Phtheirospermum japonicum TaxID=374723 RepID=A0A830BHA1_9LAMI|nr:fatty acid amide hydrolase [Phtheirospermum japonicum]
MGVFKDKGVVYKPVDEVDLGPDSDEFYRTANVKAPRMAGFLVKLFSWFLESPIFGGLLLYFLKRNNLIHKLVSFAEIQEAPLFVPCHPYQEMEEKEVKCLELDMSPPEKVEEAVDCLEDIPIPQSFKRWTILDYARAYTSRQTTPKTVAQRLIACVRESSTQHLQMSFFINFYEQDILKQATESTLRYQRGEPISVLDGVPIAIKDEIDCMPYPTTAVVAAGLCPVSLGVDGGGSVRLPAALCGVVGFKPTFERVPHEGVLPVNYTIGMVGILAATVEDALIAYAAIAGDLKLPKVDLPLLKSANYAFSDIKMARYGKWFDDCTDDIRVCCSNAVSRLSDKYRWTTVEVTVPEIEVMRLSHYVTIGSECSNTVSGYLESSNKAELGWDVRVGLAVYGSFHSHEYLNAQKMRYRQLRFHQKIFSIADVIVTPTVGVTAYTIKDDALETGELDYINGAALVRYQIAGNFLGLPAVTVPVGYDKSGLPIGLQFIGKPWSESLLIYIASAVQAIYISGYKQPEVFYDMLAKE